jgi:pyridinium-3,5-biscarboxylic acid mononucleotide sulfurtransferase
MDQRLARLHDILSPMQRAAVAFSGGVDSTFLLRVAADILGRDNVLAVTGDAPILTRSELADARELAAACGVELVTVDAGVMQNPDFLANAADRCYVCKQALLAAIQGVARARGIQHLLDGGNADDAADWRPGARAVAEFGVRSPLAEAGLTKADIRELSRALGLPTADKPAMACLATRLPYGTAITPAALAMIEAAEHDLRARGLRQVRVRHHGDLARLETAPAEMARFDDPAFRAAVADSLHRIGYRYVALDLDGYRTGSLNPRPG